MNSSFYFPNFSKSYKSAKAASPDLHYFDGPPRHAENTLAPSNRPLEEKCSGATSTFPSLVGVNTVPPPLNTSVQVIGDQFVIPIEPPVPPYSFKNELIGATRDFLRQWVPRPDFYGTLTYRGLVGENLAKRLFRKFLRGVAKLYGGHVKVAWGEEHQERGVFHHHFLSEGMPTGTAGESPSRPTVDALLELWSYGDAKIEQYVPNPSDPYHGAELYLAKHRNWDVDVACPRFRACKRKDGCKVAHSHW
jgi:hypothetical protein